MGKAVSSAPEAVLFDVGDTLVAATPLADRALRAAAEWLRRRHRQFDARAFVDAYREADSEYEDPTTNHLWGLPLDIMIKACSSEGLGRSEALAAGAVYRQEVRQGIVPDADVIDVFAALRRRGIHVGILSNGTTVEQLDTLHLLGVLDFVEVLVISEDAGWLKPDPRLTETALEGLGARRERTWLVGDDEKSDGEAARSAGMVWVRVGDRGREGDLNVSSVVMLRPLIEELVSSPD